VANISSAEILNETRALTEQGRGVCVGRPVEGVEVMVIPIADSVLDFLPLSASERGPGGEACRRAGSDNPSSLDPRSQASPPNPLSEAERGDRITVGEFVVRGPVVTPRYFNNPTATALAKIRDPDTGDILHRMGDVGHIDERGRLWFCGRKSHRVETAQGTLFTDMVEPVFNAVPGVARSALVGVTRAGVTYPVVCIELIPPDRPVLKEVRGAWLMSLLNPEMQKLLVSKAKEFPHTAALTVFLEYPTTFPVDVRHNSKIFREKLAAWANPQFRSNWHLAALRGEVT
jgi:acyl-CoA synthetase (AMP-forming)/AMP-acid ligase II